MNTIKSDLLSEWLADEEFAQEYHKERLVLDTTERIREIMKSEKVSQAELARRCQCSRSHISQLLTGSRNMTLATCAEIFFHLGQQAEIRDVPLDTDHTPLPKPLETTWKSCGQFETTTPLEEPWRGDRSLKVETIGAA